MGNASQWKQKVKVFAVKIMSVRGRALRGNVVSDRYEYFQLNCTALTTADLQSAISPEFILIIETYFMRNLHLKKCFKT